jgi:hypothetical protein
MLERRLAEAMPGSVWAWTATTCLPSLCAGSYRGADLQIMPLALCQCCGRVLGLEFDFLQPRCECCGGGIRPYLFRHGGKNWDFHTLHETFYSRSHVVVPNPSPLSDRSPLDVETMRLLFSHVARDAMRTAQASATVAADPAKGLHALAFAMGWMAHVITDGIMKGHLEPALPQFIDGQYGQWSKIAYEMVILSSLSYDLGLTYDDLLFDLPGWDDNGIFLHYMMVNEPSCYRHWGELRDAWLPCPEQAAFLADFTAAHQPFFEFPTLTSQFAAGQLLFYPKEARTPLDRLGECQIEGMGCGALVAKAMASSVPSTLGLIVEAVIGLLREIDSVDQCSSCGSRRDGDSTWLPATASGTATRKAEWNADAAKTLATAKDAGFFSRPGMIIAPRAGRPPLDRLVALVRKRLGWRLGGEAELESLQNRWPRLIVGSPTINLASESLLGVDTYRAMKYGEGRQSTILLDPARDALCLAGFSDMGDEELAKQIERIL